MRKITVSKDEVFICLIFLYVLLQSMILFSNSRLQNLLVLICMLGLVAVAFSSRLAMCIEVKNIICIYFILLLTIVPGTILVNSTIGYIQFCKVAACLIMFALILAYAMNKNGFVNSFMKVYGGIAVAISIQCLILFVVVWFGLMEGHAVYKDARGRELSFGILGYGNAINYFGNIQILRTMSFFREPSKLAAFLMAPLFWYIANIKKRKRNMIFAVIIGLNLLATFSRAGILAFEIGLCGMIVFRSKPREVEYRSISSGKKLKGALIALCGVVAVVILGRVLYTYAITEDEMYAMSSTVPNGITGMLIRSMTVTSSSGNMFVRDDSSFNLIFEKLRSQPLGFGLGWSGSVQKFNNPTGFGFWAYSGGYLAIIVLIVLYGYLVLRYYFVCMYSNNPNLIALGSAFIAITIQNMSYGSWCEEYYLITIAMMITEVEQFKNQNPKQAERFR